MNIGMEVDNQLVHTRRESNGDFALQMKDCRKKIFEEAFLLAAMTLIGCTDQRQIFFFLFMWKDSSSNCPVSSAYCIPLKC